MSLIKKILNSIFYFKLSNKSARPVKSEIDFCRLVENAPDLIYRMSIPGGKYEYVNSASESITGYTPKEYYDKPLLLKKMFPTDWLEYFEIQWKNLLKGQIPDFYEYQVIHKSGELKWLRQSNRLIKDADGNPVAIEGIVRDITIQKRNEDVLHQIEKRMSLFEKSLPMAFYIARAFDTNRGNWVSDRVDSICGFTRKEFLTNVHLWSERIHPDDKKYVHDEFKKILETGTLNIEYRWKSKSGEYVWFQDMAALIKDKNGNPKEIAGTWFNVTNQKKTVADLKWSNTILKTFIKQAPFGILIFTKREDTWTIAEYNEEFKRIYRFTDEFLKSLSFKGDDFKVDIKLSWKSYYSNGLEIKPDDLPIIRCIKDKKNVFLENIKVEYDDGSKDIYVNIQSVSIIEKGEFISSMSIIQDITSLKKTESEISRLNLLLNSAIEQSPAGMIVADAPDGNIKIVNSAAYRIRGIKIDSLIDIPMKDHPENWKTFYPDGTPIKPEDLPLSEAILKGKVVYNKEILIGRESGENRLVSASASPIRNNDGEIIAGLVVFPDITDQRKLEEQLNQSQKMEAIGSLAGGIAHDFNNILGAIIGSAEMIELMLQNENLKEKSDIEEFIKIINDASLRARDMIKELLALSRKEKLKSTVFDINSTLINIRRLCKNSFPKSIKLDFRIPGEKIFLNADPVQIEQVLLNMCINASHAMTIMRSNIEKPGGRLTLDVEKVFLSSDFLISHPGLKESLKYVKISINDTGVGIDEFILSKIFDPFFTTKDKEHGTGFGLSIAFNIIKQHNGVIDVYSEIGVGSTFRIYLPEVADESIEPVDTIEDNSLVHGSGTILLIDDEKIMRMVGRRILVKCGYDVLEAENGEEGLKEYLKNKNIDAVILDMSMPMLSGLETFEMLKEINAGVKVLMTSGFKDDERVNKAMQLGITDFIEKPFSPRILSEKLNDILK